MTDGYVWDHRYAIHTKGTLKRNEEMLEQYREGSSIAFLAEKYGLSKYWTKKVLAREVNLQDVLKNIPEKKVYMADLGPFLPSTGRCLAYSNLLYMTIEEFHRTQDAQSLLKLPNFSHKSLSHIVVALRSEGYDTSKYQLS